MALACNLSVASGQVDLDASFQMARAYTTAADGPNHTSKTMITLVNLQREKKTLELDGHTLVPSGATVRLSAGDSKQFDANTFRVRDSSNAPYVLEVLAGNAEPEQVTTGNQKALVLVWGGGSTVVTPAELDTRLNGVNEDSTASFFRRSSNNLLNLQFDVRYIRARGPRCIDHIDSEKDAAIAAAEAEDPSLNLRDYGRIVLYNQAVPNCPGWNLGSPRQPISSRSGRTSIPFAWVYLYDDLQLFKYFTHHELGHTFGLLHSGTFASTDETLSDFLYRSEYGNDVDVMGKGTEFEAASRYEAGWIDTDDLASGDRGQISFSAAQGRQLSLLPLPDTYTSAFSGRGRAVLALEYNSKNHPRGAGVTLILTSPYSHQLLPIVNTPLRLTSVGQVITLPGLQYSLTLVALDGKSAVVRYEYLNTGLSSEISDPVSTNAAAAGIPGGRCTDRVLEFTSASGGVPGIEFVQNAKKVIAIESYRIPGYESLGNGRHRAVVKNVDASASATWTIRRLGVKTDSVESVPQLECAEQPLRGSIAVEPFIVRGDCTADAVNTIVNGRPGATAYVSSSTSSLPYTSPFNRLDVFPVDYRLDRAYWIWNEITLHLDNVWVPRRTCFPGEALPELTMEANYDRTCSAINVHIRGSNPLRTEQVQVTLFSDPLYGSPAPIQQFERINLDAGASGSAQFSSLPEYRRFELSAYWNGAVAKTFLPECDFGG